MLFKAAHVTTGIVPGPLRAGWESVLAVIGPDLHGDSSDAASRPATPGAIAALCLAAAIALFLVVAGQGAGRRGDAIAPLLFWSGVIFLVAPIALRIAWPLVARGERLFLLFLLTEALFYYKVVYSPTSFVHHDEFLHWVATDDLLTARRLFLSNPLLPIGPSYPALEILTTAIVNLTKLSVFASAMLLLATVRGTFIAALFFFYERITGSPRASAIACLVYMGCTTFAMFDSMFSYETLGIMLCVLIFAVEAASKDMVGRPRMRALALIAVLLVGLTFTHHLSGAYAAFLLGTVAILEFARRDGALPVEAKIATGLTGLLAIALPLLWMTARGNPLTGYLGPVIEGGLKTLIGKITGAPTPLSEHLGAPSQPIGMRLTTVVGILLLSLGLATGFFRSLAKAAPSGAQAGWRPIQDILKLHWRDSRIVFLTFLAFGYPVSVAFRLTQAGWEIGNRLGTFVFLGVGLVVAVSIIHFWQRGAERGWRRFAPAAALAMIILGGITSSSLNPIHKGYRVAADQESIEWTGIETARWTKEWLGPGHRFTSDRINRILLAGYGRQDVRVNIVEGVYPERVFAGEKLSPDEYWPLARSELDFLLVDRRLSLAPPVLGFYFEPWQAQEDKPLSGPELLKFNDVEDISRIYDNGWIVIYDLREMHGRSK